MAGALFGATVGLVCDEALGRVPDLLVGDCTLVGGRGTEGLFVEGVLLSGRTSGCFVTDAFLWTVRDPEEPDVLWIGRRSEADDGTAALVNDAPLPHGGLSWDVFVVKEGRLDLLPRLLLRLSLLASVSRNDIKKCFLSFSVLSVIINLVQEKYMHRYNYLIHKLQCIYIESIQYQTVLQIFVTLQTSKFAFFIVIILYRIYK